MTKIKFIKLGFWFSILASFGFASKEIFVKLAFLVPQETQISAISLLALRMLFSAPFFIYVYSKLPKSEPLTKKEYFCVFCLSLLGYYFSSLFDFLGLQYISAGLERLILMTYPSITIMLGVLFFGKQWNTKNFIALLIMYFGIFIAFYSDIKIGGDAEINNILYGSFLVFISSVGYGIYLLFGDRFIKKLGSARFTSLAMAGTTLGILCHYSITEPLNSLLEQPTEIYFISIGMAIISTVIPIHLLNKSIRYLGVERSTLIGMLGPIMTIFLGYFVLNEPITLLQMVGAILVISGVILIRK